MATEVIMPKVDMVMDEGTFVEWLAHEGEQVEKGDPLFVILTDKANIEIEAPASGILGGLRAGPDDVIPVTEVIGYILETGEEPPAGIPRQATGAQPDGAEAVLADVTPLPLERTSSADAVETDDRVRATPVARRLADERGIDLTQVSGRGPRGRVHKADVLAFVGQREEEPQAPAAMPAAATELVLPPARRRAVIPLAGPRKIIAQRMMQSAFSAPHIALSLSVDMREAVRLRRRLQERVEEETGRRLSYTAIIARAVAAVLPDHPFLNASLHGEEIIQWADVHLGIATSVDDYLIVPVIREAQNMSLQQIVSTLGDLAERGRNKQLTPAQMSGSTFTISNLGMFGIESFTAIINPPEAAILAVGAMVDTPTRVKGKIVMHPTMNLTLSADHRIVDGATAARFLSDLKDTLKNPYLLI